MSRRNNRLTAEKLQRLRQMDFSKKPGFVDAETGLSKEVGKIGTPERAEFDAKAFAWYYGELLKEKRKELNITQKELSNRTGIKREYISLIEKGQTDMQLSTFFRLAAALGISLPIM